MFLLTLLILRYLRCCFLLAFPPFTTTPFAIISLLLNRHGNIYVVHHPTPPPAPIYSQVVSCSSLMGVQIWGCVESEQPDTVCSLSPALSLSLFFSHTL